MECPLLGNGTPRRAFPIETVQTRKTSSILFFPAALCQDFLNHVCRLDPGQALVEAEVADGEALVVEAE